MTLPTTIGGAVYEPPVAPPPPLTPTETAPRFAGVGQRLGSTLVDCLVTASLSIPMFWAEGESRAAGMSALAIVWAAWFGYAFLTYRRWGQTLGKWVFRSRLMSVDGSRVSDRQLVRRIGLFVVLGAMTLPGYWLALGRFHSGSYGELGWAQRQTVIEELTPAWGDVILGGYFLFMAGCVVAILLSSRKQSLHDMVAGTVVVSLRAPVPRAGPEAIGRWHRVLEFADWTLATLLAAFALFFLLAAWGTTFLPEGTPSADDAATTFMLYVAGGAAVLSALMLLAALNVRSTNRGKRAVLHWLAYILTFIPIGFILFGIALQMQEGSETFKSGVPDVVQVTPVNRA